MIHKKFLIGVAEYYGKNLSENQLKMYCEDLEDLNPNDLARAFQIYRRNPKNNFFPLPNQLKAALHPEQDENTVAIDLSTRICAKIVEKGYTWEHGNGGDIRPMFYPHKTFSDAVTAELGDIALEVIRRFGGWKQIHDAYFDSDRTSFSAQLRERVGAVLRLSRAGQLRTNPSLESFNHGTHNSLEGPVKIGDLAQKLIGKLPEAK